MKRLSYLCGTAVALALLGGCMHIEFFYPDVEGTYHLGPDRPFWAYEGRVRHVELATPVMPKPQETPSWCWAAACQMLASSQGIQLTQQDIVRRAYGEVREAGGKSPLIVQVLSGDFTTTDGKRVRLEAHRADGFPQNGLELVTSIEEGMPFIVDIGYYKDGLVKRGEAYAAHSVLAYGVTYQRVGNVVRILSLDTLDPSYAILQQTDPGYGPRQKLDAKALESVQGTVGVYRR